MANLEFQTVELKQLNKEDYLQKINWALDNDIVVNINSDIYEVKKEKWGELVVVCISNDSCFGLQDEEIMKCYINKWDVRENEELRGFNIYA